LGKLSVAEMSLIVFGWVIIYALLARFAPGKQFWHDVLAGTRLVDAKPGDAPPALKCSLT
jgi:hypothetical protein